MPAVVNPSLGRGARPRILAAARRLFVSRGFAAVGITELVAEARISRRTLYQHFASKEELIVDVLRELSADPSELPQRVLARADLTARARLLEVISALGEAPGPLRGDPLLTAATELSDPEHPGRHLIARRQAMLADQFAGLAREAGMPERVGGQLLALYCGASAGVVAANSPAPAAVATDAARALLAAAD